MKISNESYRALRDAVLPTMQNSPYTGNHWVTEGVWLWRSLWETVQIEGQDPTQWVNDRLYNAEGLKDDHIETALRAIAREARS